MISRPALSCVVHDGTFPAIGTVSRWPAITTRSDRPSSVRAMTTLPSRTTSRWPYPRSACSTRSAISVSLSADGLDVDQRPQQLDDIAAQVQRRRHERHLTASVGSGP